MKVINSRIGLAVILPEGIPKSVGFYARNQLEEYLNSFYLLELIMNGCRLDADGEGGKP